jgi:hypothetical protein
MPRGRGPETERPPVKRAAEPTKEQAAALTRPVVRRVVTKGCEDCRAGTAFQLWHEQTLTPSLNWEIDFSGDITIPAGTRAVIELVTALIIVPAGERARLRMYTSLGSAPSNLDLWVTPQGQVGGNETLVATHTLRAYSDASISFNVNRDNATTAGYALICISGYLADV